MHNYLKIQKNFQFLQSISANFEHICYKNIFKKFCSSVFCKKNNGFNNKIKILTSYKYKSISNNNQNSIFYISHKNFYERKSLKWYWREKNYDMLDGDVYKNYLVRLKNNFHLELIPQNLPDGKSYDSCLIWLYDGDFPEYLIEHLLEFNNFPPKVKNTFINILSEFIFFINRNILYLFNQ